METIKLEIELTPAELEALRYLAEVDETDIHTSLRAMMRREFQALEEYEDIVAE